MLPKETVQKIFVVWFVALTMIATYNFYHNLTDRNRQSELEKSYEQNKSRYEDSIKEHEQFRLHHEYIKGKVEGIEAVMKAK